MAERHLTEVKKFGSGWGASREAAVLVLFFTMVTVGAYICMLS